MSHCPDLCLAFKTLLACVACRGRGGQLETRVTVNIVLCEEREGRRERKKEIGGGGERDGQSKL